MTIKTASIKPKAIRFFDKRLDRLDGYRPSILQIVGNDERVCPGCQNKMAMEYFPHIFNLTHLIHVYHCTCQNNNPFWHNEGWGHDFEVVLDSNDMVRLKPIEPTQLIYWPEETVPQQERIVIQVES